MPRVFLGNFEFEHELAAGPAGEGSPIAHRFVTAGTKPELFWTWLPLAGPEDFVVAPDRVDSTDFAGLSKLGLALPHFIQGLQDLDALPGAQPVPWRWTHSLVSLGNSRGW